MAVGFCVPCADTVGYRQVVTIGKDSIIAIRDA